MIELLYKLSFPMIRNKPLNKVLSVWNRLIRGLMRKIYPFYCKHSQANSGIPRENLTNEKVVISLTSFPKRMNTIGLTLESLLRQSVKADRIILWLTKEEVPDQQIPEALKPYVEKGIEVKFADINLKPHNKSFHTAMEDSDCIIVTVDDEIVYSERMLERLIKKHMEKPDCVICELAHRIKLKDNQPDDYDKWDWEAIGYTGPSDLLLAKGVGGVLYPRGFFAKNYFNIDVIRSCCLMADDLWLKFIAIQNGFEVVKTKKYARNVFSSSKETQSVSLASVNNGKNQNTKYLKKLCKQFNQIKWNTLR